MQPQVAAIVASNVMRLIMREECGKAHTQGEDLCHNLRADRHGNDNERQKINNLAIHYDRQGPVSRRILSLRNLWGDLTMKRLICGLLLAASATVVLAGHHEKDEKAEMAPSQDEVMAAAMAAAIPGKPHAQLAESVGSYTAEMAFFMQPGGEPMKTTMTVERSMELGGRVLVEHWKGMVMGAEFSGVGRTGYDNITGEYWSTWNDNMSTGLLLMTGTWNKELDAMELFGKAVNPATGQTYKSRSVLTYPDPGVEVMAMYEDHGEGEYQTMSFRLKRDET